MKEIHVFNLVSCTQWFCFKSRERFCFPLLVSFCCYRIVSLIFTLHRPMAGIVQCIDKPTQVSFDADRIVLRFIWKGMLVKHHFSCIVIRLIDIFQTVAVNSQLQRRGLFLDDRLPRTEHPSNLLCMLILEFS
jgi:hypothetical protein